MNQEKIEAKLLDAGLPPGRAAAKAEDSAIGWVLTILGAGALVASAVIAYGLIGREGDVGMWPVLLITLFVAMAFTLSAFGMHLLAREAAPGAIRTISDALVRVIQAVRGGGNVQ